MIRIEAIPLLAGKLLARVRSQKAVRISPGCAAGEVLLPAVLQPALRRRPGRTCLPQS